MDSMVETLQVGLEHHRAGRLLQAERMYRRVLKTHPRHAGAFHLLGLVAFQVGKPDLAARYLEEALKLDAFQAHFHADLGEVYRALDRLPEAIAAYRQALQLKPEVADAHNHLGTLLQTTGALVESTACYREALRLNPAHADACRNLAVALQSEEKWGEAEAAYEKSAQLAPDAAETYFHWGTCLHEQGQLLNAIASYQKAVQLKPDFAEAYYHCGLARLTQGDFAGGWRDFEWRLQCADQAGHGGSPTTWTGGHVSGRRLLVRAEGSLGDTLQFVRYVPLVEQRGAQVFLEAQPELRPLLERSGFTNLVSEGEPQPYDAQVSLLSLPRIFDTRLETIPATIPYLKVPADLVAAWRERMPAGSTLKVGVAWQADPDDVRPNVPAIPLVEFESLSQVAGVTLIGLQQRQSSPGAGARSDLTAIVDLNEAFEKAGGTSADVAAMIANLDLVVTCDNAVAHLAGALGVPAWVALSAVADWRWLLDRDDSPWYTTARLFRQPEPGDWSAVFGRIREALGILAAR